jgi:signal transduction histidine kinase/ActR/RegA family two-component response regulator
MASGRRDRRKAGSNRRRGLEDRLTSVTVWSTFAAMMGAFTIYQWSNWQADRRDLARDSLILGQRLASVAEQALEDGDEHALAVAAALLIGAEDVQRAVYFTADGRTLTIGGYDGKAPPLKPLGGSVDRVLFRKPGVEVHVPRGADGVARGELVLTASDAELTAQRIKNIAIALGLSLLATIGAGLAARRLTRRALEPLHSLNDSMEALAGTRDFTTRAPVVTRDEVGQLTRNYNRLLGALERYDEELRCALAAVTEARDDAEEANVLKSRFLANMGHEIRTPLNGVMGMAQALLLEDLTPEQAERVELIRDSGAALLCVLNDVLDLSQIESGLLPVEIAPFDICKVVDEACAVAATLAESKAIGFTVLVADQAAGEWLGDGPRLRQVLYNLISNALKFTDRGEVRVEVSCDEAGRLVAAVSDTGIGIPEEVLPKLFGKFVQGEAGATRRFGGAGLGLAICRSLVELMGGEIEVESRPGEGATFWIRLPLKRGQGQASGPAEAAPVAALSVLVAEDNETNQRVVRTVLNALGVDPTIVADGREAVEAWARGGFDLVLMDIQMPVCDGVSATREIRRLEVERGLSPTRIVALTANSMPHQAAEYAAAGMNGLVPKPIMIETLHAALCGATEGVLRAA